VLFSSSMGVRPCPWTATTNGPAVHFPDYIYVCILRSTAKWYWLGKTEELVDKPVSVPQCPPQISHGLTRTSTVKGRPATNRLSHGTAFECYSTVPPFLSATLSFLFRKIPLLSYTSWFYKWTLFKSFTRQMFVFVVSPNLDTCSPIIPPI
jgi:hypothetical protein